MRIFVNASTLRVGGGRAVTINFLKGAIHQQKNNPSFSVIAVVPGDEAYTQLETEGLQILPVPKILHNPFFRLLLLDRWTTRQVRHHRADIVFSMGNIALPIKEIPQVVLFHNPYMIYPESIMWQRMGWFDRFYNRVSRWLFGRRLKYAEKLLVQTNTAALRLRRHYKVQKIAVAPNAVSFPAEKAVQEPFIFHADSRFKYLLCLSHYYPHKNLEVFVDVAELIKKDQLPYRLLITVEEKQHPNVSRLLRQLSVRNLEDIVINIGPVSMATVPALYARSAGLILPTLLESFSGTYIEAMHYERPVFTSNMDFAKEVCGEAAWYFDPLSPGDIVATLQKAFLNDTERERKIELGKEKSRHEMSWAQVSEMMIKELNSTWHENKN